MEITSGMFGVIGKYCLSFNTVDVDVLLEYLEEAFYQRKNIFVFGNGGSGATASHFCEDLGKGTLRSTNDVQRFKVMSLTDNTPYILAWANDEGYDTVFEQQLRNFAEPGDLAVGISGSGNSKNVLQAIEYANSVDVFTVGMTGFDGGRLREIAKHCVHVPIYEMGIVESVHLIIVHYIVNSMRNRLHRKMHEWDGIPQITVVPATQAQTELVEQL
jgi:D-sedoheptulose 7-phosphate isomerase